MNKIKVFYCGICKPKKRTAMIRQDLRKHLRKEHGIKRELTNTTDTEGRLVKKKYWIGEEFK